MGMDIIDRKLLELLQEDATMPIAELAQRVNLSQTPCWKRLQRLKDAGVIRAQVPTALIMLVVNIVLLNSLMFL